MNICAVINGINSLCSLGIVFFILLNRSARRSIHLTYALFSLLLFCWASSYFFWGLQTELEPAMFWLRTLMYPICVIHIAYFHFILIFSDKRHQYKWHLLLGYLSSFVLCVVNFFTGFFDLTNIRNKDPFIFWPHAAPTLSLLIFVEVLYLCLGFKVLLDAISESYGNDKIRLKYFLLVGIIGWCGGLTNWFNSYDPVNIPPVGNPAVTFYILMVGYLIFKHDLLQINIAFKKTFVYTTLTFLISLTYIAFIIISERIFRSFIGYISLISTLLASITIAVLFNPLRHWLANFIDKLFFGKHIPELILENSIMQTELRKQDKMKAVATLAAGMAHEIKNPLTSIKTFAEYLPEKYDDPEFRQKFRRIVTDEVDRVNNIVKQLLEFSRPADLELIKSSPLAVLEDTLALLNKNLIESRIDVVKKYESEQILLIDKNQMKQSFLNILLNGIQAMPNGGSLFIGAISKNGYFVITISDSGYGISKEDIPHVFDPFFTKKEEGTGLGLSIAHGIIKEHGGKIEVTSKVGKGTEFSIYLKSMHP